MRSLISWTRRHSMNIGLLVMILVAPVQAEVLVFNVGSDAACDFTDLQPAINAAAEHPGLDTIRVATNKVHTAQALRVGAQDLVIEGGFANCTSDAHTPNAQSTISGAGGVADSVIVITGKGHRDLKRLLIINGDETDDGRGGGIDFEGAGILNIEDTSVRQNRAGYGGGIHFKGVGEGALLLLGQNTVIDTNVAAHSGGGVRLEGDSNLSMFGGNSSIAANTAQGTAEDSGYGGGLQILPPARATISATGFGDIGAVSNNKAKYGGGVAISARDSPANRIGTLLMFTTDPQRPVRIDHNVASVAGGGIHLRSTIGYQRLEFGVVCAYSFRIDHNRAPDGAALFVGEGDFPGGRVGGKVFFNVADSLTEDFCGVSSLPMTSYAVECSTGVACNSMDGNRIAHANGQAADGAIVELQRDTVFEANRVRWSGNRGSDIVHALRNDVHTHAFSNCLLGSNLLTAHVIASDASLAMRNCTVAGNSIGAGEAIRSMSSALFANSIIWQPGHGALNVDSGVVDAIDVLSNDPASFPISTTIARDPRFVDAAKGDFHLSAASPAVDLTPAVVGDNLDLDGFPRDHVITPGSAVGQRDLGAYERQSLHPLVRNIEFLSDLNGWEEATPGISRFDPRENDEAVSRGGSLFVDYEGSDVILPRVAVRSQCVHLPLPGRYFLSGSARTSGSLPPSSVQIALLHWEFRTDGGEACSDGRPTLQGDLLITSGADWKQKFSPILALSNAQWTRNSSVTISTVMASGGWTVRDNLRGWFDHIDLLLDGYQ